MDASYIQSQVQVLKKCHELWITHAESSISEDLTQYGVPGMTKASITNSFKMLVSRLEEVNSESLELFNPFIIQTIAQNFPSWSSPLESWITALPSTPGNIPSIASHLNAMWSNLNIYEMQVNLPALSNAVSEIEGLNNKASIFLKDIVGKSSQLDQKSLEIEGKCDEIVKKAEASLAAAARAGLAGSFSDRSSEYDKPRVGWFLAFIGSLIGVVTISLVIVYPSVSVLMGTERLLYLLTEIPLTLPFIWFAWFSALRFSQLGRFKEDYKFKVATALALDGYRKQAEDISPELLEKLLDIAITNFGENPLRLMTKESAKDAHPLVGLLDEKLIKEVFVSAIKTSNKSSS